MVPTKLKTVQNKNQTKTLIRPRQKRFSPLWVCTIAAVKLRVVSLYVMVEFASSIARVVSKIRIYTFSPALNRESLIIICVYTQPVTVGQKTKMNVSSDAVVSPSRSFLYVCDKGRAVLADASPNWPHCLVHCASCLLSIIADNALTV